MITLKNFFNKGHQRTILAKKNIAASFIIKGILLAVGFVKVPIFLDYLSTMKYGVLITILSLVNWLNYFDFGLGHGLRNNLAISIANNDIIRAKRLISTAYVSFTLLVIALFIILVPITFFINWNSLLNVSVISNQELHLCVLIVLVTFLLRFVLNLLTSIFRAYQLPALGDIFLPVGGMLSLLVVIGLRYFTPSSLTYAVLASTLPTLSVSLFMNLYFFKTRYRTVAPRFNLFDRQEFNKVFFLGLKFFFIQMLAMVLFSFSNLIISYFSSPDEVTRYNIAYKLISTPFMFFVLVLTPYWTGFTDAYTKNDTKWIKKSIRVLIRLSLLFSIGMLLLAFSSKYIFHIWIGNRVHIPFLLVFVIAVQQCIMAFTSVYGQFINGVGKLKVGMVVSGIIAIIFFPIAFYFTSLWGAIGLVLALVLVNNLPSLFLSPYQYKLIINNRARGIWNK